MSTTAFTLVLAAVSAVLALAAAFVPQARPVLVCLSLACLAAAVAVEATP